MADNDSDKTSEKDQTASLSWDNLPDDLWEVIFRNHERQETVLKSLSLVSKRFLAISNRVRAVVTISHNGQIMPLKPSFYSRFRFIQLFYLGRLDRNLDATITQIARSDLPLKYLTLSQQIHFPKDAMRFLGQRMNKTLRSLSCRCFESLTDDDLAIVASWFSYLHEFDIEGPFGSYYSNHVTDNGIRQISSKLKSLVSLNILMQHRVSHQSLEYLASNCPSLRELSAGASDEYRSSIRLKEFKQFNFFKSLSSLTLSGLRISKYELVQLSAQNLNLKVLRLNHFRFSGDITGAMLCEFLKSCRLLEHLELKIQSFPIDTSAIDFTASIPCIKLIELGCYNLTNNLPPNILFYLLNCCPLLEDISFVYSSIRIGQEWFNAPLSPCAVRRLNFSCEDLSYETLTAIVSVCPKLECLFIFGGSKVSLEGVKAVIRNCRNMKYLYVDGFNDLSNL